MKFTIRECSASDAEALQLINREELGYDYPISLTKAKLQKILNGTSDKIFAAVADGQVVGYVHAADYDVIYAEHFKNIMGIAVRNEYRKCGIGRALLEEAEKWAKSTGAAGIRLCSGSSRRGAHLFYKHCGYVKTKEQFNFKKLL